MRICYFACHGNSGSDRTEEHVTEALESLGHQVTKVHERDPESVPSRGQDLLLFHKGGPHLLEVLKRVEYPKTFWYFDKFWKGREDWYETIRPFVSHGFVTDGDFAEGRALTVIRQGIGKPRREPVPRPDRWKAKIAFLGTPYGEREAFVKALKNRYGNSFQTYQDVFNEDLYDLSETVPIVVAPQFPSTDSYWSNRVYLTLGSGGFLLHPLLKGLTREYKSGKHYETYKTNGELFDKIDLYLNDAATREAIRSEGKRKTHEDYTYRKRVKALLEAYGRL